MDHQDVISFLRGHVELFREMPGEELGKLAEAGTISAFEPNEAIIEFGDAGTFLGVMLDGKAEVSVVDDAGERHLLAELSGGDVFGEMSLLTGDRTVADVIGLTPCTALLIPEAVFSQLIASNPAAVKVLSRLIMERSRTTAVAMDSARLAEKAWSTAKDPYGFKLKSDPPLKLLVVNCGSSSLKYDLFDTGEEEGGARGIIERIGCEGTRHIARIRGGTVTRDLPTGTHGEAFGDMVGLLAGGESGVISSAAEIAVVGHRVVHGGSRFTGAEIVTPEVLREIGELSKLAPLHNPLNLSGIVEAQRVFPGAVHVAVFDSAFHHTLPPYAYLYGLPWEYFERDGIRRYGFHGMSHAYVTLKAAEHLKRPFNALRIVSCHLGNGSSLCAVDHGRSVDTTMGFTPSGGLVMGTRTGDMDPSVLTHLMRAGMGVEDLDALINRRSGLLGLSGISSDMREIERAAREGNHRSLLALKVFSYGIRKSIGAFFAAMGGLDALVFTGGIGERDPGIRSLACQGLAAMGIRLDEARNRGTVGADGVRDISDASASVRALVVPTNEELMIARESLRALQRRHIEGIIEKRMDVSIPIEVSAHHVHLSEEHLERLFGKGHLLTPEHDLSQPGQFAARETVNLAGPKGKVERVRVLGPTRRETQVEIAMTEQFRLGIHPPVRESGDLEGTPGLTIEGPAGSVEIEKGVICALRHIHLSAEDALRYGLRDGYRVRVQVAGEREIVFGDVLVRVSPRFRLAMHLDTDEGNAAGISTGMKGIIVGIQSRT